MGVAAGPRGGRSEGKEKGCDGCRVPLPWTSEGPSFGFGPGGADLPQPPWFADVSVAAQDGHPDSTLTLYRRALALRRELMGPEELTWVADPAGEDVIHVERPGGWRCVTNLGSHPVALPDGEVLITSEPLVGGRLPADATAWCRAG